MEKLCIFCTHFHFRKDEQYGMGSTQTGPLIDYGGAACDKGHGSEWAQPENETELRDILLTGETCKDYSQVSLTEIVVT